MSNLIFCFETTSLSYLSIHSSIFRQTSCYVCPPEWYFLFSLSSWLIYHIHELNWNLGDGIYSIPAIKQHSFNYYKFYNCTIVLSPTLILLNDYHVAHSNLFLLTFSCSKGSVFGIMESIWIFEKSMIYLQYLVRAQLYVWYLHCMSVFLPIF